MLAVLGESGYFDTDDEPELPEEDGKLLLPMMALNG